MIRTELKFHVLAVFTLLLMLALGTDARATVQMPAIFGDHMVLQQDLKLPVWGTAEAGETVEVSVGARKGRATADAAGKWSLRLDPLAVSSAPLEMQVSGKANKLTFTDVLVGDVWLCSGQSNMEFGIGNASNAAEAIPQMNYPEIRLFLVPHTLSFDPQTDIKPSGKPNTMDARWVVCSPQNVIKIGGWNGFSAAGMFFAQDIYQHRKQPLGMIGSYWGGTTCEAWTSAEALKANPAIAHNVDDFEKTKATFDDTKAKYSSEVLPKWQADHDAWKKQVSELAPGAPKLKEPAKPAPPFDYPQIPIVLFDGMIHPLIPYGLKGVLWNQGESNGGVGDKTEQYYQTFHSMILDWRQRWGEGDLPFVFVQSAPWGGGWFWIGIRQAQTRMLALPKTGMVVTLDVGDEHDVHAKNKLAVGQRLALAARHVAYGESLVYSGPLYASSKMDGDKAVVTFDDVGGGLVIGSAPAGRSDQTPAPPADHLNGFELAGKDPHVFSPAQARIEGSTVVVTSDTVKEPHFVRYGCYGFPPAPLNLYNKEGLPAAPFSTANTPVWPEVAR